MSTSVKTKIYVALERPSSHSAISRRLVTIVFSLILLNIIAVALETVDSIYFLHPEFFGTFEILSILFFTFEYAVRVWACTADPRYARPIIGRLRYVFSPMGLIDLVSIAPFYLPASDLDLRFIRSLRLFRMLRIGKLGRYTEVFHVFGRVFYNKRYEFMGGLLLFCVLLICGSSIMYFLENETQPETFSSIPMVMWRAVASATSLGYDEVHPVTSWGRFVSGVIGVTAIAIFAVPTGVLTAGFVEEIDRRRASKKVCPHCQREASSSKAA